MLVLYTYSTTLKFFLRERENRESLWLNASIDMKLFKLIHTQQWLIDTSVCTKGLALLTDEESGETNPFTITQEFSSAICKDPSQFHQPESGTNVC